MQAAHETPSYYQRPIARISRSRYDVMVAAGAFDGERVELLDGMVVEMSPKDPRHDGTIQIVHDLLREALAGRAVVRVQMSFVASDRSEPEPDIAVVAPGRYLDAHPAKAFLIAEVANTSLATDQDKAAIYAAASVPEYWIVDVKNRVVEVRWETLGDRYANERTCQPGDTIELRAFPDVRIAVADIFPT